MCVCVLIAPRGTEDLFGFLLNLNTVFHFSAETKETLFLQVFFPALYIVIFHVIV